MTHLLDSNVCIQHLRGKNQLVRARFQARPPSDLVVCSPVVGELRRGAAGSNSPPAETAKLNAFLVPYRSLPFDDAAASVFGQLCADLGAAGTPIGDFDAAIASIALVHNLIVVTHNVREFSRVPGLIIEDWEVP